MRSAAKECRRLLRVTARTAWTSMLSLSAKGAGYCWIFFFQAEDGIRDYKVTGVQTCALPISGGRDVAGRGVVGRGLKDAHQRPPGQAGRRYRLPGLAAVAREVDETVVGAGPQDVALVERLGQREDRAVDLGAGVVARDRAARQSELGRIVAGRS